MKKVNVIFSYPVPMKHWIVTELNKIVPELKIKKWGPRKQKSLYRKYGFLGWIYIQILQMDIAYKVVKFIENDEIIISLDYGTGRYCSMFSVLRRKKHNILALNCLQYRKHGVKRYFEKIVDKLAWSNPNFITTVNTQEDILKVSIPEYKKDHIWILEDVFIKSEIDYLNTVKYDCFTGGYANRDFNLYFQLAEKFPSRKFVCVVGSNFNKNCFFIPKNVILYQDISESEFLELMRRSYVTIIPLLKDETSGLVVLKNAITYKKLVLASNVKAVKKYFPKELHEKLLSEIGNLQNMLRNLEYVFGMKKYDYDLFACKIVNYNDQLYNAESQCRKILKILDEGKLL